MIPTHHGAFSPLIDSALILTGGRGLSRGQDQIGAGIDEALVDRPDAVGMVEAPRLGRRARFEPEREQAGADGAVGDATGRRASRSVKGSAMSQVSASFSRGGRQFQSGVVALRRRRGRLSAALVRPAARRRARRRCTIARRSASSAAGQIAISSSVRMQPAHRPVPGSRWHTPMQGEGISITRRRSNP
jgi:hypothetical protein